MDKTTPKRILIIEDEMHIAEGLKVNLSLEGYSVAIASDGPSGFQQWKKWQPDLIVLDIMLPGMNGLSVLQSIRLEDEQIPILILSAKGTPDDKVTGFSLGVDDYLSKPFHLDEFLMRIKRLLTRKLWTRKNHGQPVGSIEQKGQDYRFGNNRINFITGIAYCRQGEIKLTEQELKLLKLFIINRAKPLSRRKLLEIGWGYTGKMTTRTVDNFIVRFRKYFEDNPKKPVFFKSRRSIGYVFDHN